MLVRCLWVIVENQTNIDGRAQDVGARLGVFRPTARIRRPLGQNISTAVGSIALFSYGMATNLCTTSSWPRPWGSGVSGARQTHPLQVILKITTDRCSKLGSFGLYDVSNSMSSLDVLTMG